MGGLDAIPQAQKSPEDPEKHLVVEIGCGPRPSFLDRVESEFEKFRKDQNRWYVGVDFNEEDVIDAKDMTEFAKEEHSGGDIDRIKFIKASGVDLPFKNDSVSEVVFENVMGDPRILIEDRERMLGEALRILREGGEMRIVEHTSPAVSQRQGLLDYAVKLFGKPVAMDGAEQPPHGIQSLLGTAFISRYHKPKTI